MKLTKNIEPKQLRNNLEKKEIWEGRKHTINDYTSARLKYFMMTCQCYILLTEESDICQNVDSWLKYLVIS
ncbi:hypothetical protein BT96DRAFT_916990 [Gymnopus androsaceus JB14]|uniref:Uncharacterized protein n=1 Tax=Gymnopus androsaceus JB14 TaxID=1447944 RepID=A0A6A4I4Z4_9AGAR|nr:hypothetical protein BT96DRAFT_916990 [Gymnopus androsaceus JB14]